MTPKEIQSVLNKHAKWLNGDEGGEKAILRGARLYRADLQYANLQGADLQGADLRGARLYRADLQDANLQGADLRGAILRGASLCGANLDGANLQGSNLDGANLYRANLLEAKLSKAILDPHHIAMLSILPDEGDVIGWKKCEGGVIVKLLIKDGTPRSNSTGRKCRAKSATVLAIHGDSIAISRHDHNFTYEVGKTYTVDDFDEDRWKECAPGIHFFITRAEAENY